MKSQWSNSVLKDKYTKLKWEKNEPKAILHSICSFTDIMWTCFSTMLCCLKQIKHVRFKTHENKIKKKHSGVHSVNYIF